MQAYRAKGQEFEFQPSQTNNLLIFDICCYLAWCPVLYGNNWLAQCGNNLNAWDTVSVAWSASWSAWVHTTTSRPTRPNMTLDGARTKNNDQCLSVIAIVTGDQHVLRVCRGFFSYKTRPY